MKKTVCAILALLCLPAFALAESAPSMNTADMVTVTVETALNPSLPENSELTIIPVQNEDETLAEQYSERTELCQTEIAKLSETIRQYAADEGTSGVEAYFGEVKDAEGNTVVLSELFSAQTLVVNEFMPVVVENYDRAYGAITMAFQFKTPYAKDEMVVILVGVHDPVTDEIVWTAVEGVGVGEDGAVQVEFTADIMEMIQNNITLLAVVSGGEALHP
jgi:hypothetical protein